MGDLLKAQFVTITDGSKTTVCTGASIASTILSVTLCNEHATNAETFDMIVSDSSNSNEEYLIYKDQSLPGYATFEHSDKIVLLQNDTLKIDPGSAGEIDVFVSYLEQT